MTVVPYTPNTAGLIYFRIPGIIYLGKHFDWVIAKLVLILAKQKAQIWENTYWEISFYVINQ